jgi:hypothetical protein
VSFHAGEGVKAYGEAGGRVEGLNLDTTTDAVETVGSELGVGGVWSRITVGCVKDSEEDGAEELVEGNHYGQVVVG